VLTPQQIIQAYDLCLADRWLRKDESPGEFEQWLEAHWHADGSQEPQRRPDDTSSLGGTYNGLRVYCEGRSLRGFLSRRPAGCFRINTDEVLPFVRWGAIEATNQQRGRT
jgi:hypothetical protein